MTHINDSYLFCYDSSKESNRNKIEDIVYKLQQISENITYNNYYVIITL